MRRLSYRAYIPLLLGVLSLTAGGTATASENWVSLGGEEHQQPPTVELSRSDMGVLEAELTIPGIQLVSRNAEGRAFTLVQFPRAGTIGSPGSPSLPAWRRFVEIPAGAQIKPAVDVLETRKVVLSELGLSPTVYPAQLPRPKCDCPEARNWHFSFESEAYRGVIRHQLLMLDKPATFRDHTVVRMTLSPVTYDADQGILEVATRIRIRLDFVGGDSRATNQRKARLGSRQYDSFLQGAVVNFNFTDGRNADWQYPVDAPIEFLVITPPEFVADLQPFVDWKTSCGFHVTVVTTDVAGTTTTSIKDYITGLYNGPNPPVYVLMIGDSPTPLTTYVNTGHNYSGHDATEGGSDLEFVQMDADLYPDMIIARWPIDDSAELEAMRDKILFYENPQAGSSAWLNRALFIGGYQYPDMNEFTHEDVIAELMGPSTANGAETELWLDTTGSADDNPVSVQDFIDDLNVGRAWAVYSAHSGPGGWAGDPSLSSGDFANMANTGMYPLGFGHSCQSNQWAIYGDVFGEAAVIQPQKGFVSYWGASQYTYWDGDDWLERGFFDSMFDIDMTGGVIPDLDGQYAQGAACYAGLTSVSLGSTDSEDYYWHEYNLNGDPTLDPFTRQPIGMTVTAPPAVAPAAADITVGVSDSARGAVAGALVAASQDIGGTITLLGAGFTDATGSATFAMDAPTADQDLLIRVTAHNHLPADENVVVAAGSDGVVLLDSGVYRCDSTVGIQLFDEDLDGQGTQGVTLSASPSGVSTTVNLTEVSGSPVVKYIGSAVLGADVVVADGDTLTVTYVDADDGAGGVDVPKTDTAEVDCVGPVVSSVQTVGRLESLTITFTTDEPGTTTVVWGASKPPTQVVQDTALVTEHSMTLTGLTSCTRYYFEIVTEDGLGNQTTDDAVGNYYHGDTATWGVLMEEPLDSDPGWSTTGQWAFGTPAGSHDPSSGATGSNVYGYNTTTDLNGDYPDHMSEEYLTTSVFDVSDVTSLQLHFQRRLGVESSTYDHAGIEVSTDGGTTWSRVWDHSGSTVNESSWSEQVVDLSGALPATGLQVRWVMGPSDYSVHYQGWNVDDVVLEGAVPCIMCVDPPSWSVGAGVGSVAEVNDGGSCTLTGLDIDWDEAESSCAENVWYRVWVQKGSTVDFGQAATFEGLESTELRVMGLSAGQEYAVGVRAYDEYGNEDGNVTVMAETPTGGVSGDVDGDGDVDAPDMMSLLEYFFAGTVPSGNPDVDCTGGSDASDLACEIDFQGNGLY